MFKFGVLLLKTLLRHSIIYLIYCDSNDLIKHIYLFFQRLRKYLNYTNPFKLNSFQI